jgi:peptide/nickel transport system ATP-binding protein
MNAILSIKNLTTRIPTTRGELTVVDDVSFELRSGECLGIVGESGSGKSMTCRSILGLVPAPGKVTDGVIDYAGTDLRALSPEKLNKMRGRQIAMIVQDAIAALNPVLPIGQQIAESLIEHGIVPNRDAARARSIELMRKVGIPDPESRIDDFPHQFSGGMCQRVVIAIGLACAPRVLLADEPTTALDVTIQDQILKLLVALQNDMQLSVVLVTHDMGVVANTCQRVGVMYAGEIVELAETHALFAAPRHPYTVGLLDCAPSLGTADTADRLKPIPGSPPDLHNPPSGCRFHPRCPLASAECKTGTFKLREVAPGHFTACIKHEQLVRTVRNSEAKQAVAAAATTPEPPPLLAVEGLTKTFEGNKGLLQRLSGKKPGRVAAVDDVSFSIAEGEILSLVGESGSGKTTLGRSLLRLVEPTSGEVRFRGRDVLKLAPSELLAARRDLQMIFQDPYSSLNPRLTVREMIGEVLRTHRIVPTEKIEERIGELLGLVGLPPDSIGRHPRHFSGGQRQRLGIARALAMEPSFIVADEPVSAVDVSVQAQIMNLLLDLRDRLGLTMLFITHNLSVVRYVSDRVGVMYLGRIVELAPTRKLFAGARHPYTQALLRAAPQPDPNHVSTQIAVMGEPPSPLRPPPGCHFHTRCHLATEVCRTVPPPLVPADGTHLVACHHHERALRTHAAAPEPA